MSAKLRINLGIEAGEQFVQYYRQASPEVFNAFMRDASYLGVQIMKEEAPERTGYLKKRIIRTISTARSKVLFSVISTAKHSIYVEMGTRPHLIFPKRAKALRWYDEGGRPVFAMKVRHPGTKPNPFVARTRSRLKEIIVPMLKRRIRDMLERGVRRSRG